jgi:hypothetical protein
VNALLYDEQWFIAGDEVTAEIAAEWLRAG